MKTKGTINGTVEQTKNIITGEYGIWPARNHLNPSSHNVIYNAMVNPNRILLLPLNIKLVVLKNIIKAFDQNGSTMHFHKEKVS